MGDKGRFHAMKHRYSETSCVLVSDTYLTPEMPRYLLDLANKYPVFKLNVFNFGYAGILLGYGRGWNEII